MDKFLKMINENNFKSKFKKGNFGIEKENIRVDKNGEIASTDHPKIFLEDNEFIKRDFSESQIELVTPAVSTVLEAYNYIRNLHNIASLELNSDEYLWPQSNPPVITDVNKIKVAKLNNLEEVKYRENLMQKYGAKKQLISGVHFNFSFKEDLLKDIYNTLNCNKTFREFKDDLYFKIGRNFLKYKWFLVYLTGASPVFHKSYCNKCTKSSERIGREDYYLKGIYSLRNSKCGYKNNEDYYVSYNDLNSYVEDVYRLIQDKCIQSAKEYYSPIRFKTKNPKNVLENLKKDGVEYIEIRMLDLDPTEQCGVSLDTLYLMHLFLLYTAFKDDEKYTIEVHNEIIENDNKTLDNKDEKFVKIDGKDVLIEEAGFKIISELQKIVDTLFDGDEEYKKVLDIAKIRFLKPETTISSRIIKDIRESTYSDYFIDLSKKYLEESKKEAFKLIGYEDFELSTQILIIDALKNGIKFDILDRDENFISLNYKGHTEYVKQATKTSKDSYITALIMENKLVTKKVLEKNNIRVPKGGYYEKIDDALEDFYKYENKALVVKPKTTNFGIGISIFKASPSFKDYKRAVEIAFSEDRSILIEEFIEGKEYRFLVIEDEVVGILHRVPANVTGDGEKTIKELVEIKNMDPLRGKGYKTPLEKISLTEIEETFLKESNKDFNYIPKSGEVVYLRENSNISTGGDSIDFTDDIDESYKKIAIECAKTVDAKITGVDVMIQNIKEKANINNYGIIEINFNPAIHIHCFPYKGINRKVSEKVLKLLFKEINFNERYGM